MPPGAIASTVHLVPASDNSETVGVTPLAPVPSGRMDGEVGVWYANIGKANGIMYFRCEALEQLTGVSWARRTSCRGRYTHNSSSAEKARIQPV